ncbi:MAG: pyrroline-5-carboxylate reductase [Planctomycetota bacterium]|nr:MAG: pyrroline-5-carboxylate reductase [Planctomycetota bacterium]
MGIRIGFIGAGRMAQALAGGMIGSKIIQPENVKASDPSAAAREAFQKATGAAALDDNEAVVGESDVVFLAVKPQQLASALEPVRDRFDEKKLVVSIAAGVRLGKLTEWTGGRCRLVRVMPNTPCLVGQGASAYCLGPHATDEDGDLVERLLKAVGCVVRVDEKQMDAVTGLSGSGPAFVYVMIEALADAGVRVGLPRAVALTLAAQTVKGAAEMVLETGEHPGALKDAVASPGGTTIAGLHALELCGVRAAFYEAVSAAAERSAELGG